MRLFRRRSDAVSGILGWELHAASERHGLQPGDIPAREVAAEFGRMAQESPANATTIKEAIERVAQRVAESRKTEA